MAPEVESFEGQRVEVVAMAGDYYKIFAREPLPPHMRAFGTPEQLLPAVRGIIAGGGEVEMNQTDPDIAVLREAVRGRKAAVDT